MIVKNNWFLENLGERLNQFLSDDNKLLVEPCQDFDANFNLYEFQEKSFDDAVDEACKEISEKYDNLFLAYSGGMDSEFVLRAFHRNGIKITPLIVCCGNEFENEYAYETCEELNIEYIKIEVTEDVFFNWWYSCIKKKFNGTGINAVQLLFAAEVATQRNGTLITGDQLLGQGDSIINDEYFASSSEWDFYTDHNFKNLNIIPFFLYTPELTFSMFPFEENGFWNDYKSKLYKIPSRRKLTANYSDDLLYKINSIFRLMPDMKKTKTWSKKEIFETFNKYKR